MTHALRKLIGVLATAGIVALALTPPSPAAAATSTTYFRYCNKGHLGFGMTFHVVTADGGHVANGIRYDLKDTRSARDNTIVIFQKGPALFHREGKQTIYALDGETVFGTVTNASSDNKWHTLSQASFSMHPLPLGTFPYPGSSYWKLFLHYVVAIWPHGKGTVGCSFNLEVDGPTNAYFP